jgi:hypothetical protein
MHARIRPKVVRKEMLGIAYSLYKHRETSSTKMFFNYGKLSSITGFYNFDLLFSRYSHLKLLEKSVISRTLNPRNFSYVSFYLRTFLDIAFITHLFEYLKSLHDTHFAYITYTPYSDIVFIQYSK